MTQSEKVSLRDISFWQQEAKELKRIAELCWQADEGLNQQIEIGRMKGIAGVLIEEGVDTERELRWLYNNLAAFAVYYLAIGILIYRNPQRFLHEAPQQRIVELVEECGLSLNDRQRQFLLRVENAYACLRKNSQWTLSLQPNDLRLLKRSFANRQAVSQEEKLALDELFDQLDQLATEMATSSSR